MSFTVSRTFSEDHVRSRILELTNGVITTPLVLNYRLGLETDENERKLYDLLCTMEQEGLVVRVRRLEREERGFSRTCWIKKREPSRLRQWFAHLKSSFS